jgi:SAM-dependent methyltransferase
MPADDAAALLDRCRASPFLDGLDRAIAPDATVLDAGCGTGQITNFLGLAGPRRAVLGADLCRASLAAAEGFRARADVRNVRFVRADLFALPTREERFDVVISRGVVHHTPDPARATAGVARRVRPGGMLVLGFYESIARMPHQVRQAPLARRARARSRCSTPVLRRRDLDARKKETWIEDQYRHPLERLLPFPGVTAALEAQGFLWVRSVPPATTADEIFTPTPRPGALALFGRRLNWAWRCLWDEDAGLVCVVLRRRA